MKTSFYKTKNFIETYGLFIGFLSFYDGFMVFPNIEHLDHASILVHGVFNCFAMTSILMINQFGKRIPSIKRVATDFFMALMLLCVNYIMVVNFHGTEQILICCSVLLCTYASLFLFIDSFRGSAKIRIANH